MFEIHADLITCMGFSFNPNDLIDITNKYVQYVQKVVEVIE